MSYYASASIRIFSCDPALFERVLKSLNERGLILVELNRTTDRDYGETDDLTLEDLEPLTRGRSVQFVDDQAALDVIDLLLYELPYADSEIPPLGRWGSVEDRVPTANISFSAHQDPAYEFDGEKAYYCPELGKWRGSGDSDGTEHFRATEIDEIIATHNVHDVPMALNKLTGKAWRDHFQKLQEAANELETADMAAERAAR